MATEFKATHNYVLLGAQTAIYMEGGCKQLITTTLTFLSLITHISREVIFCHDQSCRGVLHGTACPGQQ